MTETKKFRIPWRVVWPALAGAAVFIVTVIVGAAMSPQNNMSTTDWQVQLILVGGIPAAVVGLIGAGLLTRREVKRQMTQLQAESQVDGTELLSVTSCGYLRGYRGHEWPITTGGLLALTSRELIFRSGGLDFSECEVRLPLHEVEFAERCEVKFTPCGLKVNRIDGPALYFLLNAMGGTNQVEQLAESINGAKNRSSA